MSPKAGVGAVEAAERAEACERVGVGAVRRPEAGGEKTLRAEDAEVVGLGNGSRDVIPAAAFIFRDGDFHAGVFGVDLGLQAAEDVDGRVAKLLVDPRIAVVASVKVGSHKLRGLCTMSWT